MTPEQKVATLMVVLGEERAGALLASLPKELTRRVLGALARLDKVDEASVEKVVEETLRIYREQRKPGLDPEAARRVLDAASALLRDTSFRNSLESGILAREIGTTLEEMKPSTVGAWLSNENPNVAATVLSLAAPAKAAEIFRTLPQGIQPQVCLAIAHLQQVDEGALQALHDEILELRKRQTRDLTLGGAGTVARLLQHLDAGTRQTLLEKLDEKSPALTEELRRQLLSVEKIATLLPRDLGKVCAAFSDKELALLLRPESEKVRGAFLAAISRNRAEAVVETLGSQGAVRRSDVETVRQKLQALVEKLHGEGGIVLPWEDQMV